MKPKITQTFLDEIRNFIRYDNDILLKVNEMSLSILNKPSTVVYEFRKFQDILRRKIKELFETHHILKEKKLFSSEALFIPKEILDSRPKPFLHESKKVEDEEKEKWLEEALNVFLEASLEKRHISEEDKFVAIMSYIWGTEFCRILNNK